MIIRVRVKERIITVPGQAIGQGSAPRAWVVTCGGGGPKKAIRCWRFKIQKYVFLIRFCLFLGLQKVPGAKNWRDLKRKMKSRT